jgi:hypothetical protein
LMGFYHSSVRPISLRCCLMRAAYPPPTRWTDRLSHPPDSQVGTVTSPRRQLFPERETPPVAGSAQAGSGFLNLLPTDVEGRWQSKHASRQASARCSTQKHNKTPMTARHGREANRGEAANASALTSMQSRLRIRGSVALAQESERPK